MLRLADEKKQGIIRSLEADRNLAAKIVDSFGDNTIPIVEVMI